MSLPLPDRPKLAENLLWFTRALREAGLRVGPGATLTALQAIEVTGFGHRADFYATLQSVFVARPEERAVFDQLFRLFWRDPRYQEHMMSLLLPSMRGTQEERVPDPGARRAAEALAGAEPPPEINPPDTDALEITPEAQGTASADEKFRQLDFEQMSVSEAARARAMIAKMRLPIAPLPSRRFARGGHAQPDPRATLRLAARRGGEVLQLAWRKPKPRPPQLVVICDISGSMSDYSRMVLHFAHALASRKGADQPKVQAFTFGTRLTNITRHLRGRDVDAALRAAGAEAQDWRGGTRIGECLRSFNRDWSRRMPLHDAVVLLITDGLERGDPVTLGQETARLALSCRRLVWLNPLLRWEGFAPRARGISAMLPHVHCLRAGHSIASLEALGVALTEASDAGDKPRFMATLRP